MKRALGHAAALLFVAACSGVAELSAPAATQAPIGTPVACSRLVDRTGLPCESGVAMGQPYALGLYTHCGIGWAYFDGRWWVADPPQNDRSGNPPRGWKNPVDVGAMTLVTEDQARFVSEAGLVAEFRALSREAVDNPESGCL